MLSGFIPCHIRQYKPLLTFVVLTTFFLTSQPASSASLLEGYLSALFNMAEAEVRSSLKQDNIEVIDSENADGDHLLFGQRNRDWIKTDLLYVFPNRTDKLSLVIEVFPGLLDTGPVRKELEQKFGKPSSENYPDSVIQNMQEQSTIPAGVRELTVWDLSGQRGNREIRMMLLDKYVRVEYIDNDLMSGE